MSENSIRIDQAQSAQDSTSNYSTFLDYCPSCGRRVVVGISFLGQDVCCSHCHKRFRAQGHCLESNARLSQRIERLLDESQQNRASRSEKEGNKAEFCR